MTTPRNESVITDMADLAPMPAAVLPISEWHRLTPKTILVRPFNEVLGLIVPLVVALFALGHESPDRLLWGAGVILLLVLRGVLHWATTKYRVTEEQVEMHTGLLFRQKQATRRERVRTVESTAKLGHRLFGVTAVRIGTGQHEQKKHKGLVLDAVTSTDAEQVRRALLDRSCGANRANDRLSPSTDEPAAPERPSEEIASLQRKWLRYAPLTLSGLAAIAALAGIIWRTINELGINVANIGSVRSGLHWIESTPTGLVIAIGVVGGLIVVLGGSVIVYIVQFAGYRLTREPDATLHVRRGLLTKSAVTIEEARLRGVEVSQPLLLRLAGGARCLAVATGLQARNQAHVLMPPGPLAEANRVAGIAVREPASPTTASLEPHPRVALRRRLLRTLFPACVLILGLWLATLPAGWLPQWPWQVALITLPIAVALGYDRFRNLGHTLTGRYLVTRFGSLDRKTVALQRSGIIGWRVHESFFQRRTGLITLAATTAAGPGVFHVLDLAKSEGLAFADEATPGILTPFLERD
ncbi:MAG TPA: PH domain-containing protein [Pseudonocardiaceae bacterium]|jgi:putative membrane protein|nr:PH domain-containing protein [Pseudonocardiaceae bacterium]